MRRSVFILFLAFLLCNCGGPQLKPTTSLEEVLSEQEQRQAEVKELNRALFASVESAPSYEDYLIGEGDLLSVSIFEAPELNTEARVSARGYITLPLLGPVEIKGLTASEAEQKIEDLYRRKYLQDPHVTIFVKEQYAAKITLLGAVNKPGTYDYPSRQRLLDVLAMCGGLSDKAGKIVQVRRKIKGKDRPEVYLVDLDELIRKGRAELNIPIYGGDVIFVPEGGVVYVDGAVRKPGMYPIKGRMTVQEAIIAAGGFSSIADESSIKLIRVDDRGKREVLKISLNELQQGKARDLFVQDRDVVFVETNEIEALFYGLRLNLGMGLVGLGYMPPPH